MPRGRKRLPIEEKKRRVVLCSKAYATREKDKLNQRLRIKRELYAKIYPGYREFYIKYNNAIASYTRAKESFVLFEKNADQKFNKYLQRIIEKDNQYVKIYENAIEIKKENYAKVIIEFKKLKQKRDEEIEQFKQENPNATFKEVRSKRKEITEKLNFKHEYCKTILTKMKYQRSFKTLDAIKKRAPQRIATEVKFYKKKVKRYKEKIIKKIEQKRIEKEQMQAKYKEILAEIRKRINEMSK